MNIEMKNLDASRSLRNINNNCTEQTYISIVRFVQKKVQMTKKIKKSSQKFVFFATWGQIEAYIEGQWDLNIAV